MPGRFVDHRGQVAIAPFRPHTGRLAHRGNGHRRLDLGGEIGRRQARATGAKSFVLQQK
jgi:hypothetical protein